MSSNNAGVRSAGLAFPMLCSNMTAHVKSVWIRSLLTDTPIVSSGETRRDSTRVLNTIPKYAHLELPFLRLFTRSTSTHFSSICSFHLLIQSRSVSIIGPQLRPSMTSIHTCVAINTHPHIYFLTTAHSTCTSPSSSLAFPGGFDLSSVLALQSDTALFCPSPSSPSPSSSSSWQKC